MAQFVHFWESAYTHVFQKSGNEIISLMGVRHVETEDYAFNELKSVLHLEAILKNEIMTIDHPTQIRFSDTELFFFFLFLFQNAALLTHSQSRVSLFIFCRL